MGVIELVFELRVPYLKLKLRVSLTGYTVTIFNNGNQLHNINDCNLFTVDWPFV